MSPPGPGDETKGDVVLAVRRDLEESADEKTRESGQRFFKEEALLHGVKAAVVREIAKRRFKEIKSLENLTSPAFRHTYEERQGFRAAFWISQ